MVSKIDVGFHISFFVGCRGDGDTSQERELIKTTSCFMADFLSDKMSFIRLPDLLVVRVQAIL